MTDAFKCVCEDLQSQNFFFFCISPSNFCCVFRQQNLEGKCGLKTVTACTLRSTRGCVCGAEGSRCQCRRFFFPREGGGKNIVLGRKRMKGNQEKSFKNGPNRLKKIGIHVGWHHHGIPEKPLEGISFLTYTRWPLCFLELCLYRIQGPFLLSLPLLLTDTLKGGSQAATVEPWRNAITLLRAFRLPHSEFPAESG